MPVTKQILWLLHLRLLPRTISVWNRYITQFWRLLAGFDSCGKAYAVQWGKIGRTEADIVVYNEKDRCIAAIKAVRAGSEDELPLLAEKAFQQLKDNAGCGGRVKRNRAVWSVTFWGWRFTKSTACSWPAEVLLRQGRES